MESRFNNHLINKAWLLLVSAILMTALLGLPRISVMLQMEASGFFTFTAGDYLRRLSLIFLLTVLLLSINLYIENIRWGPFYLSFAHIRHVIMVNLVVFTLVHLIIFFSLFRRIGLAPGPVGSNIFLWTMATNASMAIVSVLIGLTYRYVRENYFMRLKNEALQKETFQAKFAHLREQINPHFMFNSFATLNGLIDHSPDKAKKFLLNMSELYRYVLRSEHVTTVSLQEEMNVARVYMEMIRERFNNAVQFTVRIGEERCNEQVVPLSLQMLLENAVKHNNFDSDNPLEVLIERADGYLEVKNNLNKRKIIKNNYAFGLHNLNQRYKYVSKQEVIIRETSQEFSVKIPLLHESIDH